MKLTYSEGGKFYAIIRIENGFEYYSGPWNSHSTAYSHAKAKNKARISGFTPTRSKKA